MKTSAIFLHPSSICHQPSSICHLPSALLHLTFLLLPLLAVAQPTVELNTGWTFRQERLQNWHPATVPGTVHTDLMALGSIADPFYGLNERTVQWIDKEDWLYHNQFTITAEQQQCSLLWHRQHIQQSLPYMNTHFLLHQLFQHSCTT